MKLVLLHAFPLDEQMWAPQLEAFEDVVAPGLYRAGSSMEAWAESVLRLADGPFALCGASMGGYCALAIARRAPERVTALLLAGARVEADSPERRTGRADTVELIRSGGVAALWEDMRPKLFSEDAPADVVDRARVIALDQDPSCLVGAVEAIRDRPDSTDVVASLDVPLIVGVGEHDPFLSVDEARGSGGRRAHVFHGSGHLPSMERPDEFNALLSEILE